MPLKHDTKPKKDNSSFSGYASSESDLVDMGEEGEEIRAGSQGLFPLKKGPHFPAEGDAEGAGDMGPSTQEGGLWDVLRTIYDELTGAGIAYVVIGSAAAAFYGADIQPADVDVVVKEPADYRKLCKLFRARATNSGVSQESALEVPMAGMMVEFLNPEIGKVRGIHARSEDYYVIDKMDVLTRACSREKGVRLKEIKIISDMIGRIDFSDLSSTEVNEIMEDVHHAMLNHLEATGAQLGEALDVPESPEQAIVMLNAIEALAASQDSELTASDREAIQACDLLEERYSEDDIDDNELEARIKELYSTCSAAGRAAVYKWACGMLGDVAPQPSDA
ncbi:hypothetical protein D3C77_129530 [compost metagenome]